MYGRTLFLSTLFLCSIAIFAVDQPKPDTPSLPAVLEKIRSLVREANWQEAYAYSQKCPKPEGFEWNYFCSYIFSAARYKDNDPSQKRGRAAVAQLLKLYDVAFAEYQHYIDLAPEGQEQCNARMDAATCANEAGIGFVKARDYRKAAECFEKMHRWGYTWQIDKGKMKRDLVNQLIEKESDVDFRLAFTDQFWFGNDATVGKDLYGPARDFLLETLKFKPTEKQEKDIYRRLQTYSSQLGNRQDTETYANTICRKYPDSVIAHWSQFALAQFYVSQKTYEKARDTLLKLLETNKLDKWTIMATLGLSEVYADLKDEENMVKYLKLAAKNQAIPTNTSIMDVSDTKHTAIFRLGKHYFSKKDYRQALSYFKIWNPSSDCGTCIASLADEKNHHIAQCLIAMGEEQKALKEYLLPYVTQGEDIESIQSTTPALIVAIYEKNNKLDQFLNFIEPYANQKYNEPAKMARTFAQIRILKRDRKVAELQQYATNKDLDNDYRIAAKQALNELSDKNAPDK